MIDTIVLILKQDMYRVNDHDKFMPSARWILKDSSMHYSGIQSKQKPTKQELLKGIYKPRLTLAQYPVSHHKFEPMLKVELSLPKLLYGNNFNELRYKDFNVIIEKLSSTLAKMGVIVEEKALINATVLTVHYSKNIPLTDGSTPYHYINKIKEANVKLSLDTNQTDYRNEGHSYKWHCNSYEIVFYDKIKDLEKAKQSSKRTVEKDSELQQHLFKSFQKRNKLEFLRMEVRLNKRAKIRQLFKKLDIKADLTFKKLFKPAISKKILLHYVDELEINRSPFLNFKVLDDKTFLSKVAFNNPTITPKQVALALGLKHMLEAAPLRELKNIIGRDNQQGWHRLMKEARIVNLPTTQSSLKIIREYIMKFKPISFP